MSSVRLVLVRPLAWLLVGAVRGYQLVIRPWLPPACRFVPGCSDYFIQAVAKYGPVRGALKGAWRVCRCHPLSAGGYDPP